MVQLLIPKIKTRNKILVVGFYSLLSLLHPDDTGILLFMQCYHFIHDLRSTGVTTTVQPQSSTCSRRLSWLVPSGFIRRGGPGTSPSDSNSSAMALSQVGYDRIWVVDNIIISIDNTTSTTLLLLLLNKT